MLGDRTVTYFSYRSATCQESMQEAEEADDLIDPLEEPPPETRCYTAFPMLWLLIFGTNRAKSGMPQVESS